MRDWQDRQTRRSSQRQRRDFFMTLGVSLFVLFAILPTLWIKTEPLPVFEIGFKFGFLPLLFLNYLFAFKAPHLFFDLFSFRSRLRGRGLVFQRTMPFFTTLLLTFVLSGYLLAGNTLLGRQQRIVVTGTVQEIQAAHGENEAAIVVLNPSSLERPVKLSVRPFMAASLAPGSRMHTYLYRGSLGLIYDWRR